MISSDTITNISFYLNGVFIIIIIILLIVSKIYQKELDFYDLIKLYDIGENDSIISNVQIRKEDGQSCSINTSFPDQDKVDKWNEEQKQMEGEDYDKFELRLHELGPIPLNKKVVKKGDCI